MDEAALDEFLFDPSTRWLERAPYRDEPTVEHVSASISARDGVRLSASVYEPSGPARHVVVIAPATGVRRGYYRRFSEYLARNGVRVVTFDYRGIGGSKELPPAIKPTMRDWGELDLAGVLEWAEQRSPGLSLSLIGHSAGGQVVGLVPHIDRLRSLVFVAAQSGDYRLWPKPSRYAMRALWSVVIPGLVKLRGELPAALGIGQSLPAGVALEWARWGRTKDYLVGDDPRRAALFARYRGPILAFGFDDDNYAPPNAVGGLLAFYSSATIMRRQIDARQGLGHFGFFRPAKTEPLWREVADFILAR